MTIVQKSLVVSAFGAFLLAIGCGSGKEVPTASCSSSAGITASDCTNAGDRANCEKSSLDGTTCRFENCDSPPTCLKTPPPNATTDAGRDPKCDRAAPNGLFSEPPPCTEVTTVTINGADRFACKCGGACPCGYQCGSITLATGGAISNVCAP